MDQFDLIQERLEPLKAALLNHRVYAQIHRLKSLCLFMEHHVFAVWDFMSLLKVLQQRLCCVAVPWLPPVDFLGSRLVNEIVLAEESDDDGRGGYASHFELYRRAMVNCGANDAEIQSFLKDLRRGDSVSAAIESRGIPESARRFVRHTFETIDGGSLCAVASAFTFGREDLLPSIFQCIVDKLNTETGGRLDEFKYYLDRHISLDEEHHAPMAKRLIMSICGEDAALWGIAEQTAMNCLSARLRLWDGISDAIHQQG